MHDGNDTSASDKRHVASSSSAHADSGPRELVWRRGVSTVGDDELISVLLGAGMRDRPARMVARDLLETAGGLATLSRASPYEVALIRGVGAARAARVVAAFELGRRAITCELRREALVDPRDVFRVVAPRIAGLEQEVFFAIGVDVRSRLLDVVEVARGSVHAVEVHPREVFRPLVRMAASGGVLAHNHPSGDPTPSRDDVELTRRLRAVGELIGIPIVDHVIVTGTRHRSIAEWMGVDLVGSA
jgi:DNA repair protein RadC